MRTTVSHLIAIAGLLAVFSVAATAGSDKPFGGKEDVRFSKKLWKALEKADLVGAERINVQPFEGNEPHGSIQQVFATEIRVGGRSGEVRVKHNHYGEDIGVQEVYDNQNANLKAVTVMYKRESGYDPENLDWFWAKYLPDGTLDKNPKGMPLAGRVAKGTNKGCIACHRALGGGDLETLTSQ